MSIERKLLKKVISGDNKGDFFISYDLYKEIYELLAQPEQTEQEPVAWMQDSIELYVLEEKSAIRGYVIPLYTTPPRREPLSDEAILKIATKVCLEDMGLEMNPQDFKGTGVFELSRAIEKAHGITGVDDETRWSL